MLEAFSSHFLHNFTSLIEAKINSKVNLRLILRDSPLQQGILLIITICKRDTKNTFLERHKMKNGKVRNNF